MPQDYQVVSDYNLENLEGNIKALLSDGWQTSGGISVVMMPVDDNGQVNEEEGALTIVYYQAMVK
jgi:hypothetical protein